MKPEKAWWLLKNSPLTPRFGGPNRQFKIRFQKNFQTTWKSHFKNNEQIPENLFLKTGKDHGNMEFCQSEKVGTLIKPISFTEDFTRWHCKMHSYMVLAHYASKQHFWSV